MKNHDPYYKPIKPKNSLELLRWVIFEPLRIKKFEETLSKKEQILYFLKTYLVFCLIFTLFWFLANAVIAYFNLPDLIIDQYRESFQESWNLLDDNTTQLFYLLDNHFPRLTFGLAIGLAIGLTIVLVSGLAEGLAIGLTGGLIFGLAYGLAYGLYGGLAYDMVFGLVFGFAGGLVFGSYYGLDRGLAFGMTFGLFVGIVVGMIYGLAFGFVEGMTSGLAVGLTFVFTWCVFYYRIYSFPYYYYKSLFPIDFTSNIYIHDISIWLPNFTTQKKLISRSRQNPEEAKKFNEFLLENRFLQRKLSAKLAHSTAAAFLEKYPFHQEKIIVPVIPETESGSLLGIKVTPFRKEEFQPSDDWLNAFISIKKQLIAYQHETNLNSQLDKLEELEEAVQNFKKQNQLAPSRWNHYYFNAIPVWEEEVQRRLEELREKAIPIVRNPYRTGDPLHPEKNQNREVFLGRKDMRDELVYKIQSSEQMPLFLFRGQRRVGKTSLLNFLPEILGSGFKVVKMDLQGADDCPHIPGWLGAIQQKTAKICDCEIEKKADSGEENNSANNWLKKWQELEKWLAGVSSNLAYRIVLAFDEYEELHRHFQADEEQGERLLSAMRSFSQRQNKIVFLFTGAKEFFELENPNWGRFFVNSITLTVDYLNEEDTLQLIENPFAEFPIIYHDDVPQKIYELAQGHPAITQEICKELIDYANFSRKKELGKKDLEKILTERIILERNHPLNRFWNEFCDTEALKNTVREIVDKKNISDPQNAKKLLRHQFIVRDGNRYKMRAPIFDEWIKKWILAFE